MPNTPKAGGVSRRIDGSERSDLLDILRQLTTPEEMGIKSKKEERAKRGIKTVPANLGEALDELESDRKFLNPIFANDVIDKIIELERKDHREISIRPHPHEFYLYFDV